MVGRTIASLALLGALLLPATVQARETIVGTWRHDDGVCTMADGGIQILPMGIRDHDMQCDFRSVTRKGDIVTWKGTCNAYGESPEPATVVATLRGKLLTLASNGRPWEGRMVRCSRNQLDGGK